MKEILIENERYNIAETIKCTTSNSQINNGNYKLFNSIRHSNIVLISTPNSLISLDDLNTVIPSRDQMLIFLSKHVSNSKTPTLTSHSTGNFAESNMFGGRPKELGNTFPSFQKQYMKKLFENKEQLSEYEIIIEATHHGPTHPGNPMLFIEIGSTQIQWNDRLAASVVCKCVIDTISEIQSGMDSYESNDISIGIGGTHYPAKFNDLILFSDIAFGAIVSKHNLKYLDIQMINQMVEKSIQKINFIHVEEKGLGKEKAKVVSMLKDIDIEKIFI
jgi:D-aminoacyl-tRNA deacylase